VNDNGRKRKLSISSSGKGYKFNAVFLVYKKGNEPKIQKPQKQIETQRDPLQSMFQKFKRFKPSEYYPMDVKFKIIKTKPSSVK